LKEAELAAEWKYQSSLRRRGRMPSELTALVMTANQSSLRRGRKFAERADCISDDCESVITKEGKEGCRASCCLDCAIVACRPQHP
jgi:hypothetical protein